MTMIVDQVCDGIVYIELSDRSMISIPSECFETLPQEGDVLRFVVDKETTQERKTDLTNRLNKLFNKTKED